jgi:voltage-gated potassium channel
MASETRTERSLDRWLARATTPRGAAIVIAVATTSITVGAGLLMTALDQKNFPSLGGGLWWAVQTVTTVGYGDVVPNTAAGQIVAALVMLLGIGFVTGDYRLDHGHVRFTSTAAARRARLRADCEQLQRIDARLERIEAALSGRDL